MCRHVYFWGAAPVIRSFETPREAFCPCLVARFFYTAWKWKQRRQAARPLARGGQLISTYLPRRCPGQRSNGAHRHRRPRDGRALQDGCGELAAVPSCVRGREISGLQDEPVLVRPSQRPGQSHGTPSCQRCLQQGHWTYECKNEPAYSARPTRTQQLKNPKVRMPHGPAGWPPRCCPRDLTPAAACVPRRRARAS